jgi:tRNA G46 methylase TrmB
MGEERTVMEPVEETDVFAAFAGLTLDDDDETPAAAPSASTSNGILPHDLRDAPHHYTSRKPKWWTRLGAGKATKGQRKAQAALAATHQLPRLAYGTRYDWTTLFRSAAGKHDDLQSRAEVAAPRIWIELGCGTGDNLLALAERHDDVSLIGCEMHYTGIGRCFQRIYQAQQRQRYWQAYTPYFVSLEEKAAQDVALVPPDSGDDDTSKDAFYSAVPLASPPYANLRIFPGNGVVVLQAAPTASVEVVLVTFPDPFGKHPQYRLLQLDVLEDMARIVAPVVGHLVVATDHEGHAAWVQAQVEERSSIYWQRVPTTPALRSCYLPVVSKYEVKGWREGSRTHVLIYQRTTVVAPSEKMAVQ